MNFIEELRWRGLLFQEIPGTEDFLNENKVAGYLGVDPTSDSMHIGNLVSVMLLVHLQRAGHTPFALVGGATGMVGDPSGKDQERQLLSVEQIEHNVACIRKQLEHFLDFEAKDNPAQMVNNYDWFKNISFLEFLRDAGKHLTINYMMSKESVKKRLQGDSGISYTEFAYQLLQGYDFYHLYKNHDVKIQVGGSDQWGNITTGLELIRRKLGSEAKAYAVVCPLITNADGKKMGKTAGGQSVWLDPKRTSPYQFYQYWVNLSDIDAERYIKIFTLKTKEEIEALVAEHTGNEWQKNLQKALAEDVTLRVHGEKGLKSARKLTSFFYSQNTDYESLADLSAEEWEEISLASRDIKRIPAEKMGDGIGILDLMVELDIASSKGEARRAIEKDKSVKLNNQAFTDSTAEVKKDDLFHDSYFQIQKGKKNRYIVVVES
ncbi:MAG: tyrosine--tRNA ligase [Bacteroidetes bacterium]|nr:tyrosine--tRNA ligase [Bacteroidota bacterium]MCB0844339.1 tyrosine--tRNA ligase [Bacteroidota bacterium]MCB0853301.1 tyrosine--tRNA ligase [Bacteroidota bacterium]